MNSTVSVPETITAIAVDANVMPRGSYTSALLEEICEVVEVYELEAEIWIAEPVLWEWVEHLSVAMTALAEQYRRTNRKLTKAGVNDLLPDLDGNSLLLSTILERLTAEITDTFPEVKILRLHEHPSCAVGGVYDQVLQVGAGRRKGIGDGRTVKTGASDGSILRLLEAYAGDSLGSVVLLSADDDVRSYFREKHLTPVIFESWRTLRDALVGLRPASDVEHDRFVAAITDGVGDAVAIRGGIEIEGAGSLISESLAAYEFDFYLETYATLQAVEEVTSVVEVDVSDDKRLATAAVEVQGFVEFTGVWWNDLDDKLEYDAESHLAAVALDVEVKASNGGYETSIESGQVLRRIER